MASATLIPVSEYLRTTYRPDCDYLEGELKERHVGEQPHSRLQLLIGSIFVANRLAWDVRPMTEQRVQVAPERYRIPDICVVRRSAPNDPVIHQPPLLCIEVLSKDDTLKELHERVNDYAGMGVAHIWAVDPWTRLGYYASRRGFMQPEDGVLRIEGTPIAIALATVFAELDEN